MRGRDMLSEENQNQNEKPSDEVYTLGKTPECKHHFALVRSDVLAAECRECRIGLPMSPGMNVDKGHVYLHGELVV